MHIDFSILSSAQIYNTMIQTVIPRPVAWVLSDNGDSSYNLAPFSYFNAVSSTPPIISLSIGLKKDQLPKDTRLNITQRNYFVVHIPHVEQAQDVTDSAIVLPHGISEINHLKLATVQDKNWPLPRLKDCRIAYLCELEKIVTIEGMPQGLILGRIKELYLDDTIVASENEKLLVNAQALNPLVRLGGSDYASLQTSFTVTPSSI